jgi:hypothetical protein
MPDPTWRTSSYRCHANNACVQVAVVEATR